MRFTKLNATLLILTTLYGLIDLNLMAAAEAITLKARSTSINMQTAATRFDDGVVINHGNLQINAATLIQQQDTAQNQEKMQLSGKPVKITFRRENSTQITNIEAETVIFYPDLGILKVTTKSKLQISENGHLKTSIIADSINLKLDTKKIETIDAEGSPLQYDFLPGNNKEPIFATAEKLFLNQQSGDVELYNASVKQKNDQFRAGIIMVDGATGNLSAHSGDTGNQPSMFIELDQKLIDETKKELQP